MTALSPGYLARAEVWLLLTTLVYFFMNGAQVFETAVVVPRWTAAPPESLHLLRGRYGLDLKTFWVVLHSLHEVTFLLAIGFCWRLPPVRNGLLLLFGLHFAVRLWTLGYFAPIIIAFQQQANDGSPDPAALARATTWRQLNYLRVGLFMAVACGLLPLCSRVLHWPR